MRISEQKCSPHEASSISVRTVRKESDSSFRQKVLFWFRVAVSALTLTLLVRFIEPGQVVTVLRGANLSYIGVALGLVVLNLATQVLKWHYLLSLANPHHPLAGSYKSLVVGYPLAFVTPGRLGEVGRAFFIRGISQAKTLRLFFLDKLSNLQITLCVGLVGLSSLYAPKLSVFVWLVLMTLTALSLLSIVAGCLSRVYRLIGKLIRTHHFSRRNYLTLTSLSTLFYLIYFSQFVLLLLAFDQTFLPAILSSSAGVFLAKTLLPISFGDLGIREGAAIFFLGEVGVAPAAAFNAAFMLFLINIGIPTLLGIPVLVQGRKDR